MDIFNRRALQLADTQSLTAENNLAKISAFKSLADDSESLMVPVFGKFSGKKTEEYRLRKNRGALNAYDPNHEPKRSFPNYLDMYYQQEYVGNQYVDKSLHSVSWHTIVKFIHETKRWGLLPVHSVVGKAISALGKYNQIVHHRIVNEGFVSNRYPEKMRILNHYQDCLEALQALEKMANTKFSRKEFKEALNLYLKTRKILNANLTNTGLFGESLEAIQAMVSDNEAIAALETEHYRDSDDCSLEELASATGSNSILTFVKKQMIASLGEMQAVNQAITYDWGLGFAGTRGDLNSCIVDAKLQVDDHLAHPYNSVTDKQCGIFGKNEDTDSIVCFDSEEQGFSDENIQKLIVAVSFIEGMNQVVIDTNGKASLVNSTGSHPLKTVAATKWSNSDPNGTMFWRVSYFLMRLFVGLSDLVLGPLCLLIGKKAWSDKLTELATAQYHHPDAHKDWVGKKMFEAARPHFPSLRSRFGDFFTAVSRQFLDLGRGLFEFFKSITISLVNRVRADYESAEEEEMLEEDYLEQAIIEAQQIPEKHRDLLLEKAELDESEIHEETLTIEGTTSIQEIHAVPEYVQESLISQRAYAASMHGGAEFLGYLRHNIYDKHPFVGLLFTTAYAVGGLSVLAPTMVAPLGPVVGLSQSIGTGMANGLWSEAIAAGFTLAKMTGGVFEGVLHGYKSWVATGLKGVEKDPALTIVAVSAAVAAGYILAYEVNIPFLSEHMREDVGTAWPIGTGFFATKLLVIAFEFCHAEKNAALDLAQKELADEKAKELKDLLRKEFKNKNEKEIQIMFETLTKEENIKTLQEKMKSGDNLVRSMSKKSEPMGILLYMSLHARELPYLSAHTKDTMLSRLKEHFDDIDHSYARSLRECFYPKKPQSILVANFVWLASYVQLALRLVAAPFLALWTRSMKPIQNVLWDAAYQIGIELTITGQTLNEFFKTVGRSLRTAGKTIADVLMNSLLSRTVTSLFNSHLVTRLNYRVSVAVDTLFEKSRQSGWLVLPWVVDKLAKMVGHAHPMKAMQGAILTSHSMMKKTLDAKGRMPSQHHHHLGQNQNTILRSPKGLGPASTPGPQQLTFTPNPSSILKSPGLNENHAHTNRRVTFGNLVEEESNGIDSDESIVKPIRSSQPGNALNSPLLSDTGVLGQSGEGEPLDPKKTPLTQIPGQTFTNQQNQRNPNFVDSDNIASQSLSQIYGDSNDGRLSQSPLDYTSGL